MPPEPLPCERKDFFKERKHERSETSSPSLGGSTPRWRDTSFHYLSRWPPPGFNDFRRPPGRGWHAFGEESGHAYASSRSGGEKIMEEENLRLRGEGRYGRNCSRESRGSSQRDWKVHSSWEMNNRVSPNALGRPLHDVVSNDQRSVDDMLMYTPSSHAAHSDFVNSWDHQLQSKEQHDNTNINNKMGGVNGLGTGQKGGGDSSLVWRPLKWSRSGSMSSRGSGYSHSSSSKSLGADSNEGKAEFQPKNVTPVQSPSGDVAACVTSTAPFEEATSRKKPRLGWGEGLAKYEKKKVEGPDLSVSKDGVAGSSSNAEPINSQSSNLADKSPRVMGFSDCGSPATPSSVACSSSPGVEEKTFSKAVNADNDSNLYGSPNIGSRSHREGFSFNLERMDTSSIANLGHSLVELLQSDLNSVGTSFVVSTAMNKLLIWKGEISKALEVTESEIDLLENELKSMKFETGCRCPHLATSSSFPLESNAEHCNELGPVCNNVAHPSPLQVASCADEIVEYIPLCNGALEEVHADVKDDDIDSPGTATSKFVETLPLVKAVPKADELDHGECFGNFDLIQSVSTKMKCSDPCVKEETGAYACRNVNMLQESRDASTFSSDVNLYAHGDDNLCNTILASNKEYASRAFEVFSKLLPMEQRKIEFLEVTGASSQQNDALVKEKFATRKQFLRFNERVVTLKFKAFQHLWKEDMRLLSIRKYRAKSQKKYELSLRTASNAYQKHRSSIRSRFCSPAGNLSLVPTSEMLNFTAKLLSDSHVKQYRNSLKMPALIFDKKEKMMSQFLSFNGLVDDPCAVEKERAMINPWTSEEREIFMDKLTTFGKDFKKIASFLDHKSTADCVEFYYKNHKSDCFEKTKKSKQAKSSTNYLVASSKKLNREMNAASLDILGAASVMAADADNAVGSRELCASRIFLGDYRDSKMTRGHDGIFERSSNFGILGSERETVAADVLAGICGSVSSEAMGSCLTTTVDPGEASWERKCQKVDSVVKQPLASDITWNVDEETCSDESCGEMDPTDWTDEEKSAFIHAVSSYGKDFARISWFVRTKSRDQCKVFFSKARKCLGLDLIHPVPGIVGTPVSDDASGGGSDIEDAYALHSGVGICGKKLGPKMVEDLPLPVMNSKLDASSVLEATNLCNDYRSEDNNATGISDQKNSKVGEILVPDSFQMEDWPNLTIDACSKVMNGSVNKSESSHAQKILMPSVHADRSDKVTEEGICISETLSAGDPGIFNSNAMDDVKAMADVSEHGIGDDLRAHKTLLPENGSNRQGLMQESNIRTKTSQLPVSMDCCSNFSLDGENLHEVYVELDFVEKASVGSLPQEGNVSSANSLLHRSASIHCEKKQHEDRLSSTLDLQESGNKEGKRSVSRDDCLQHSSGRPFSSHNDGPQILRGYPLQVPIRKETNGDIPCQPLSEVVRITYPENTVASSHYVVQDCYVQKCNTSSAPGLVHELPLLSRCNGQASDCPRENSGSVSDLEKPCRNGDVKLFGKILSNPSSVQTTLSRNHEDDGKGVHSKPSGKSSISTLKFAGHHDADGHPALTKSNGNSIFALGNVPTRSYSFWKGNGIQTGSPSLPDSARLLAAYPAAFSSYQAASSKGQQQGLQAAVKSNDCNLNGASVFPPIGSNGVVDYQMYWGHEGTKVQPLAVDMKQREDIFSEMQRLNGLQGSGVIGMNVVGRGGIVVGGPCSGVSDPVAAIKMHYAKTDKYAGQNGNIIRREESWRGKGNIDR